VENPPRAIAPGLRARFDEERWTLPPVFDWLAREGGIADAELRRTFNCGHRLPADRRSGGRRRGAGLRRDAFVCGELAPA
jgi:hypothetical protein